MARFQVERSIYRLVITLKVFHINIIKAHNHLAALAFGVRSSMQAVFALQKGYRALIVIITPCWEGMAREGRQAVRIVL